jgi:hypothetical protein
VVCDRCHGKRLLAGPAGMRPCEECGGLGVLHCCEGLQAQPAPPRPIVSPHLDGLLKGPDELADGR